MFGGGVKEDLAREGTVSQFNVTVFRMQIIK